MVCTYSSGLSSVGAPEELKAMPAEAQRNFGVLPSNVLDVFYWV